MKTDLNTLPATLYVHLDDRILPGLGFSRDRHPGRKPALNDIELLCLLVAQQLLGIASDRKWIHYAHPHLKGMFPALPQQSGWGKRVRQSTGLLSAVITELARDTPSWGDITRLIDSTPLPCGKSRDRGEPAQSGELVHGDGLERMPECHAQARLDLDEHEFAVVRCHEVDLSLHSASCGQPPADWSPPGAQRRAPRPACPIRLSPPWLREWRLSACVRPSQSPSVEIPSRSRCREESKHWSWHMVHSLDGRKRGM